MLTLALLVIGAFVLGAAAAVHIGRLGASLRGPRLVTCPESGVAAAVEVDTRYSAVRSAFGRPHFRLSECSRWPERGRCGQACLGDLEASPESTRVAAIVEQFYVGRHCALCGWEFGRIRNEHQESAVVGPDGVTHEWSSFAADTLPVVLRSHAPVCWNCHVRQSFRRRHPEIFGEGRAS